MALFGIFGINQNVVQVYNDKYVELFGQDLIDVALKAGWIIKKSKKHHFILEVTVASLKNCCLFVTFLNLYLVIQVCQV